MVGERAEALAALCEGAETAVHGGGHFVPTLTPFRTAIRAFLQRACPQPEGGGVEAAL